MHCQEYLLNLLDNLPRIPISDSLMRILLWLLGEAGVANVPSLYRLRKIQKELREMQGVQTLPCRSTHGNVFFINNPRTLIAQVCLIMFGTYRCTY